MRSGQRWHGKAFAEGASTLRRPISTVMVRSGEKMKTVDMVFVAPDDPLALGMVDAMENVGIDVHLALTRLQPG